MEKLAIEGGQPVRTKGPIVETDLIEEEELNALMAAQIAWMAVHKPERLSSCGDPAEGVIYLPNLEPPPDLSNPTTNS